MHALIFASGKGKRLRPLTNKTYKALLPLINDECLLAYWVRLLGGFTNIDTVYISMCEWIYQIVTCVKNCAPELIIASKVKYVINNDGDNMFSSGGATFAVSQKLAKDDKLIVVNSDTYIPREDVYSFVNAESMVEKNSPIMLGIAPSINILDQSHVKFRMSDCSVISFQEKQCEVKAGAFWAGIAMLYNSIIDESFKGIQISEVFDRKLNPDKMKVFPLRIANDMGRSLDEYYILRKELSSRHYIKKDQNNAQ